MYDSEIGALLAGAIGTGLLLLIFALNSQAQIKLIPAPDKNLHFTLSAGLTSLFFLSVYNYTGNKKLATIVSFAAVGMLGVTKELTDSQFSWEDIAADIAGWGAMTGIITITININKHERKKRVFHRRTRETIRQTY